MQKFSVPAFFRKPVVAAAAVLAVAAAVLAATAALGIAPAGGADWASLDPEKYREAVLKEKHRSDPILSLYRDQVAREEVVEFFAAVVRSEEIARIILKRAEEYDISPSLAAALGWEESRYNPYAMNRNRASVDRGLFQLNSKSFPKLTDSDFYDPDLNARYGLAHLRWCLDLAGSEIAGLAMYNAGTTRVRSDKTPKTTLDYISRIQEFKAGLNALFAREVGDRWSVASDGSVRAAAPRDAGIRGRTASALFPLLNGGSR